MVYLVDLVDLVNSGDDKATSEKKKCTHTHRDDKKVNSTVPGTWYSTSRVHSTVVLCTEYMNSTCDLNVEAPTGTRYW